MRRNSDKQTFKIDLYFGNGKNGHKVLKHELKNNEFKPNTKYAKPPN